MGRLQKPIDWSVFEKLCERRCTREEIAEFLDVNRDTITDRVKEKYGEDFTAVSARLGLRNNCSIRALRFKHAQTNYKAFEEVAARYLGEFPLIGIEKQETDPFVEGKFTSLMASLEKYQIQSSERKIADNNNNEAQKS